MTRIRMIHGAITPDLANYARDEDNLVSRDEFEEANINATPCPLVERTPTPEREVWSETMQYPNHKDAMPISSSTPCRSRARTATEDTIGDPFSSPSIAVTLIPEEKILIEKAQLLEDGFAALAINSSEVRGSLDHLLSADIPVSSLDLAGAITVRDLANATPRPSTSPEPESMSIPGSLKYVASKEGLSSAMTTGYPDSKNLIPEELRLGSHFLPYNVETEALPSGPFADRDYQKAVKVAKLFAGIVADHLRPCETASQDNTQLYKIQKRAEELQRFDSPVSRTIGFVGDSAAGELQPSL